MKANSKMTHAVTQLSLHSNILVMNVIVNLPGDTDNLIAKYKSTLR